jgi:hypothetical protein
VRAPDLGRDAVGTIAAAYRALGLQLGEKAAASMSEYMTRRRQSRGPRHVHAAEGFGLDPNEIRERFSSYCQRFDL